MYHHLAEGDLVSFHNRRILHAREAFDVNSGERHLRGTYVDLDEFYNRFRTLSEKFGTKVSSTAEGVKTRGKK